jgi:hypothetical protein
MLDNTLVVSNDRRVEQGEFVSTMSTEEFEDSFRFEVVLSREPNQ